MHAAVFALTAGFAALFTNDLGQVEPPTIANIPPASACEAALATVRSFTATRIEDRPWVVSDGPAEADISIWVHGGGVLKGQTWTGIRPPTALAEAWIKSAPRGALPACQNVQAYLAQMAIRHGEDAVNSVIGEARAARRMMTYSSTILSVSLPVVSASGNDALVDVGLVGGGLAGAGSLHHLHRSPEGEWIDVGVLHTWIS